MRILTEKDAEIFLEKENFPIVQRKIAKSEEEVLKYTKEIGYPIALKIVSKKILHKTETGGVKLDLRTEQELKKSFNELKKISGFEACLVQKFVPGHYVLIGLKKDKSFGHVLAVGLGGIFTEVIKDVSFRICPITRMDTLEMLKELKSYIILHGTRGFKPVNIHAIEDILLKTSKLAEKYPDITELDINPVVVNEKQAIIVDARIIFD